MAQCPESPSISVIAYNHSSEPVKPRLPALPCRGVGLSALFLLLVFQLIVPLPLQGVEMQESLSILARDIARSIRGDGNPAVKETLPTQESAEQSRPQPEPEGPAQQRAAEDSAPEITATAGQPPPEAPATETVAASGGAPAPSAPAGAQSDQDQQVPVQPGASEPATASAEQSPDPADQSPPAPPASTAVQPEGTGSSEDSGPTEATALGAGPSQTAELSDGQQAQETSPETPAEPTPPEESTAAAVVVPETASTALSPEAAQDLKVLESSAPAAPAPLDQPSVTTQAEQPAAADPAPETPPAATVATAATATEATVSTEAVDTAQQTTGLPDQKIVAASEGTDTPPVEVQTATDGAESGALQNVETPDTAAQDSRSDQPGVAEAEDEPAQRMGAPLIRAEGVDSRAVTFFIADFQNLGGGYCDLGRYAAERLVTNLTTLPGMRVLPRRQLVRALLDANLASPDLLSTAELKALGEASGADAIIMGTFTNLAQQWELDVRVHALESGSPLFGGFASFNNNAVLQGLVEENCVSELVAKAEFVSEPDAGADQDSAEEEAPEKEAPPQRPVYDNGDYRLVIENVDKRGSTVSLLMTVANSGSELLQLAFRDDAYLIDENGDRWNQSHPDTAGLWAWGDRYYLVQLLPGGIRRTKLRFKAVSSSRGRVFSMVGEEYRPNAGRVISVAPLPLDEPDQ